MLVGDGLKPFGTGVVSIPDVIWLGHPEDCPTTKKCSGCARVQLGRPQDGTRSAENVFPMGPVSSSEDSTALPTQLGTQMQYGSVGSEQDAGAIALPDLEW